MLDLRIEGEPLFFLEEDAFRTHHMHAIVCDA